MGAHAPVSGLLPFLQISHFHYPTTSSKMMMNTSELLGLASMAGRFFSSASRG